MKKVHSLLPFFSKILVAFLFTGMLGACEEDKEIKPKTITDIVLENDSFSILRAALRHAGLEDALKTGPLTVFAPSNAAFRFAGYADAAAVTALSENTVRNLLKYHMLSRTLMASDIGTGKNQKVQTILSKPVSLVKNSSGTFVNGVKIVATDIKADNGVIHVIDRLLNP
jgi:uncharacterized surface protein with fasciclin (FAS1) repeats